MEDGGGWGGATMAHIVDSPAAVDAVLADAEPAGRPSGDARLRCLGWLLRDLRRPRRAPLEIGHNPGSVLEAGESVRLR